MSLLYKAISNISIEDINSLIDNKVPESRQLVYRSKFPSNDPGDLIEYLIDVTAMANSGGGDIIYGIINKKNDKSRYEYEIKGYPTSEAEKMQNKMEAAIIYCIEPPIRYYQIKLVKISISEVVFVLRVIGQADTLFKPKSGGIVSHNIYHRTSSGVHPMNYYQIKQAIASSSDRVEIINKWRNERIKAINDNNTFAKLKEGAKLVLHVMPIYNVCNNIDTESRVMAKEIRDIYKCYTMFNVDGVRSRMPFEETQPLDKHRFDLNQLTYIQFFRNGATELVNEFVFNQYESKLLPWQYYERYLILVVKLHFEFYKSVDITPPFAIGTTILDIEGYTLHSDDTAWRTKMIHPESIKEGRLILPNVIIDDYNDDIAKSMKPAFDLVWNACNLLSSKNYDINGTWTGNNIDMRI